MPARKTSKKIAPPHRGGGSKASKRGLSSSRTSSGKRAVKKGEAKKVSLTKARAKPITSKKAAKKAGPPTTTPNVMVVNMIPRSLSWEINQDAEPSIAVNPANLLQIVGTAFTPNPAGGDTAPIFISTDGGKTWTLNAIVPSGVNPLFGSATGDITVAFGGISNKLYAGILQDTSDPNVLPMDFLSTDNFASQTLMKKLLTRDGPDQPYVHATTMTGGQNAGKDALFVGSNSGDGGQTSTLDFSLNASATNPTFKTIILEQRSTGNANQDGPQVRPASHPSGVVYAAYTGWRATTGNFRANTLIVTADIVVVRDDNWGNSPTPFTALVDPSDNLPGIRVVRDIKFPFHSSGNNIPGQNRLGGDISIAIDPSDNQTIYLAYAEGEDADHYTLHLRVSKNGGQLWSPDLLTVPRATNPALSVNSDGKLGFLYQQLTGSGSALRWETHIQIISPGGGAAVDLILSRARADFPVRDGDPYLGDYVHLQAVGKDFYGIFSGNNTPDNNNFPNGVIYQRNADFKAHKLLDVSGTKEVAVSIDPFFFKITG